MIAKNEVATKEQVASNALVNIDPASYVIEVYAPFKERLANAIDKVKDVVVDVTTPAGMTEAKECRALFRTIRIDADKERAARKAPLTAINKLIEETNTKFEAEVTPLEDQFDKAIKAEEKRLDDIKAAKILAEETRKAELQTKLDQLKDLPLVAMNLPSIKIQELIDTTSIIVANEEIYQERFVEAELTLLKTLSTLKEIYAGKVAQETLAANQAIEAANAAAKKAEQDAEDAKQANINAIKTKINNIKGLLFDAADCTTLDGMELLLDKVGDLEITTSEYGDFFNDAEAAKKSVHAALIRQYNTMEAEHKAQVAKFTAEQEAIRNEVVEIVESQPVTSLSQVIHSAAPAEIANVISPVELRAVVVEKQDDISSFLKSRNFSEDKYNEYRAVIVEFVKFTASINEKKAA